ncbi:MAG: cytochrome P450 [Acidimicrobiales bacterium]
MPFSQLGYASAPSAEGRLCCPVAFDPFGARYLADPYAIAPELLEAAGPRYWPDGDLWLVARYDQVESVFSDAETYSAAVAHEPLTPIHEDAVRVLTQGFRPLRTMSDLDGPEHSRIRRHNQIGFRDERMLAMEPVARRRAVELISDFPAGGAFDLVESLARPLPAWVTFALLGFPPDDAATLQAWGGGRMAFGWGRPTRDEQVNSAHDVVAYFRYCERYVERKLHDPGDDLAGDLIRIHLENPSTLNRFEVTHIVFGLSFVGHETTANLISNMVLRLLRERDGWRSVVARRLPASAVVDEVIRYDSSIITWRRVTTREVTLGDTTLPAGAKLLLLLGVANRDPRHFDQPERFDPTRSNAADALSFGIGKHHCLGAPLAKMIAAVALEELAARCPDLELVEQDIRFDFNLSFRGPAKVVVRG